MEKLNLGDCKDLKLCSVEIFINHKLVPAITDLQNRDERRLDSLVKAHERMDDLNKRLAALEGKPKECKHEWGYEHIESVEMCGKCFLKRKPSPTSLAEKIVQSTNYLTITHTEHLAQIAEAHFKERFDEFVERNPSCNSRELNVISCLYKDLFK